MRKYIIFILASIIATSLFGCGSSRGSQAVMTGAQASNTVEVADPQTAVYEIYDSLGAYSAEDITEESLEDLGIDESHVVECYGKISNPNDGLADVAIILPVEEYREEVHLALSKYKEKRMDEFENYDILDAYSISQSAVIYDQGEYVIMLMLADVEDARDIVDQFIPL